MILIFRVEPQHVSKVRDMHFLGALSWRVLPLGQKLSPLVCASRRPARGGRLRRVGVPLSMGVDRTWRSGEQEGRSALVWRKGEGAVETARGATLLRAARSRPGKSRGARGTSFGELEFLSRQRPAGGSRRVGSHPVSE
jgi:hypothetical protein